MQGYLWKNSNLSLSATLIVEELLREKLSNENASLTDGKRSELLAALHRVIELRDSLRLKFLVGNLGGGEDFTDHSGSRVIGV